MPIKPGCKFNDLTGQKIGILHVIEKAERPKDVKTKHVFWRCKCDCGKEIVIPSYKLTKKTKIKCLLSCGCESKKAYRLSGKRNLKNISGKRFGKLLVIKNVPKPEGITTRSTFYECKCDCGNTKIIRREHLTCGRTISCGCYKSEASRKFNGKTVANGSEFVVENRIYSIYMRCAVNRNIEFEIDKNIFFNFLKLKCYYCGRNPQRSMEYRKHKIDYNGIDRLDNTKGYTKDNCVPCCEDCNKAKRMLTEKEFKKLIIMIYNNYTRKEKQENENNVSSIGAL